MKREEAWIYVVSPYLNKPKPVHPSYLESEEAFEQLLEIISERSELIYFVMSWREMFE